FEHETPGSRSDKFFTSNSGYRLPMRALELVHLPPLMARTSGRPEISVGLIDGPVFLTHPELSSENIREVPGKFYFRCAIGLRRQVLKTVLELELPEDLSLEPNVHYLAFRWVGVTVEGRTGLRVRVRGRLVVVRNAHHRYQRPV